MTIFECPKDGCDYEGDSLPALRSHANARTDHDWSELKDDVGSEDDDSEQPDGDNDQELAGEQTEASQTDEYDDQWSEGEDNPDPEPDGDADDDQPDDDINDGAGSTTSDGSGSIGSGAALVAGSVLIALIVLLTKDNDEPEEVPSESSDVPKNDAGVPDNWNGAFE